MVQNRFSSRMDRWSFECFSEKYRRKVVERKSWFQVDSLKGILPRMVRLSIIYQLVTIYHWHCFNRRHEHIYEQILKNLIRTDELPDNILGMSRLIGSSKVILSTLGLLSNPTLEQNGLYDVVPFERLVVDEASQINVFEYMVHFTLVIGDFCG